MYRSAARRLLLPVLRHRTPPSPVRIVAAALITKPAAAASFSTTAGFENIQNENNSVDNSEHPSNFSSSSSNPRVKTGPKAHWQDEHARVLHASLNHVIRLGWTNAAMIAGAREVGVSPSIVGSFPRKEAALVEMQAPYISKWPQALSIQAQPLNISMSFKQRAMLVDEIWHAVGDDTTDVDWYVKRTVLGGIYSTTELYMLTDTSPDFQDTWEFLDGRIKDAFDLKKTAQEGKYLVEAVAAGMGGSVQGIMKRCFSGLNI